MLVKLLGLIVFGFVARERIIFLNGLLGALVFLHVLALPHVYGTFMHLVRQRAGSQVDDNVSTGIDGHLGNVLRQGQVQAESDIHDGNCEGALKRVQHICEHASIRAVPSLMGASVALWTLTSLEEKV